MPENTIITASGRSLEEIAFSVRANMKDMVNKAIEIGLDLMEAKEACKHGEWLPWLEGTGISKSTAANYMKVAREIHGDSPMAKLPYSKVLALLSLPEDEREKVAEVAESMSAAEIRKLTEERNRAAEAANAETARADAAEKAADKYEEENAQLRSKLRDVQRKSEVRATNLRLMDEKLQEAREKAEKLRADLLIAENNRVEVEVAPKDYEDLKRQQQELISAAAEAEERASAAEAEIDRMRAEGIGQTEEAWKILKVAMTRFMADCEMLVMDPHALVRDQSKIEAYLSRLESWADQMRIAMVKAVPVEGAVV